VVLSTESEGANRARMLSAAITGTFITGDDFSVHGQWSGRAKAWYQNAELLKVIENGKAFEPVEGNTGENASEMFTRKIGNAVYLAVFNYADQPKELTIDAKRIGLSPQKEYLVHEILQGNKAGMTIKIGAADAALYKFEVK
jgi:alpha-galactosidase